MDIVALQWQMKIKKRKITVMGKSRIMMVGAVAMLLSCYTTVKADNLGKLSDDVRRLVTLEANGMNDAGVKDGKVCVFIRFNGDGGEELLAQYGCQKVTQLDDIYIVKVPTDQLGALAARDEVERIETNTSGELTMDVNPAWMDTNPVYTGVGLPQGYDGAGVLVGIVDCGFDMTNPLFYSTDGKKYRLKGAVDEYAPEDETIGVRTALGGEYIGEEELLAKQHSSDTFNDHGTHCIGIAAGSGYGSPYRGVAHGADIFAITSKNGSEDYANAADQAARMKRIFDFAEEHHQPCVISYSISFNAVPDDSRLFEEFLSKLVGPGRILVVSAGNRNLSPRYIRKDVGEVTGTALNIPAGQTSTAALMADKPFQVKCFATQKLQDQVYTLSDSVLFDTSALPADTVVMGDYHVILEQRDGYYKLSARSDNKALNELPLELSGDEATIQAITLSGQKFDNLPESYISSNRFSHAILCHNIGIPSSFENTITVGALNGRRSYTNYRDSVIYGQGALVPEGKLGKFSSCGPTLDGRMKPDVVTPGINILSAGNSFKGYGYTMVMKTQFNGREYPWVAKTGTSMSTPCAAGVIALWLQADPTLTPQRIREILKKTCKKVELDGEWPNNGYGYGLMDAYAGIVEVIKGTTGIQQISSHQPTALTIRPAASGQVRLSFNQAPIKTLSVTVYSVSGTRLCQQTISPTGATTYTVTVPQAKSGAYIVQVNSQETGLTGSEIIRW